MAHNHTYLVCESKCLVESKVYSAEEKQKVSDLKRYLPAGIRLAVAYTSDAVVSEMHALVCNGQAVSRTTYADLFAKIGTTYGVGDGSTTFNVPDDIGRFIEGGTSNVGGYKDAGLPNIKGNFGDGMISKKSSTTSHTANDISVSGAFGAQFGGDNTTWTGTNVATWFMTGGRDFNANRCSGIYKDAVTTVQPKSTVYLPMITY